MAADLDVSRGVLPVDDLPADGVGRRKPRRRRTTPTSSHIDERTDTTGRQFCEVVNRWQYAGPEDAKLTAAQRGAGFEAVGLTPWQPAFAVPAITGLNVVAEFRDSDQKPNETPMIRIFEGETSEPVAGSQ